MGKKVLVDELEGNVAVALEEVWRTETSVSPISFTSSAPNGGLPLEPSKREAVNAALDA